MKFTTDHLQTAINIISPAIAKKSTMPILAHAKIEATENSVKLTASDLQTEIQTEIPADIKTPGQICINSYPLRAFSKNAGDLPITIECTEKSAKLKAKGHSKVNTLPAADYPLMPSDQEYSTKIVVDAAILSEKIHKIEHCAGRNDVRYYLNAILFQIHHGSLQLTDSNGHMLATTSMDIEQTTHVIDCIVPIKSALLISKIYTQGSITLQINSSHIKITDDKTTLTCTLTDAKYPDFTKILNTPAPHQTEINNEELIHVLETASITADSEYQGVTVTIGNNALTVKSHNRNDEESTASIDCEHDGDEYTLGFNVNYLINTAHQINGMLYINSDTQTHIKLQPRDRSVTYILMPMRI